MTQVVSVRQLNWPALTEVALLICTAVMLLAKAHAGVLIFYIHPRYTLLVAVCGGMLLLIAAARAGAIFGRAPESFHGRRGRYLLLALPLILGVLVPARPLGAVLLPGTPADPAGAFGGSTLDDGDTSTWNLLQWATALSVQGDALNGKAADVVGFVYHDPERPFGGFFVVRYVITCCAADGSGVRLPVVWGGAATLPADTWVRVRGTLGTAMLAGQPESALLATAVEVVPQPANPYLYP
jgi:uncharacterized repeat protein (TIGR03943 family)